MLLRSPKIDNANTDKASSERVELFLIHVFKQYLSLLLY